MMIKPPLQIIDVGNGCKAYSASIYRTNCNLTVDNLIPILS